MSLEVTPVGVACNLACPYCYENPLRDAGNVFAQYDMDAMKVALNAEGGRFTLFGGEPLLMRFADLEELVRWGFEKNKGSSVQTNGALITPAHLDLFDRYNVSVGISVDGPDDLNDSRWAGSLEKTRAATAASFAAIDALIARKRAPSLIVTLYRGNAVRDRLERLVRWFEDLDAAGVTSVRLHALEIETDDVRASMALSESESVTAFTVLFELQSRLRRLKFDVFSDMASLLMGGSEASCIWHGCDPLTTPAVRAVTGQGGLANCSRTNKDGVDWVKADVPGRERSAVLFATPFEDGGCKDCRFFFACQGQCPGTAIGGDWRNRSEQCGLWFKTFERLEHALVSLGKVPISLDETKRQAAAWRVLEASSGNQAHGDHWDAPEGHHHADGAFAVHGDAGTTTFHGDAPHGDQG